MGTELPGSGVHRIDRQGVVTEIGDVGVARDCSSDGGDDDEVSGADDEYGCSNAGVRLGSDYRAS